MLLGWWQLERLEWKKNLLANIENNLQSVVNFPFNNDESDKYKYMNSEIEGKFMKEKAMYFYKSNLNGKSGFRVIIPFQTLQQKVVYVDIGWIQYKQKDNINLNFVDKDKIFKISGTLLFSEERKVFTPENDYVNNTWFLLNIDEMNLKHNLKASNYILKLKNQKYFKELLIEFNPTNISNNHLEYAITWFLMAFVILILYFYLIKQQLRHK